MFMPTATYFQRFRRLIPVVSLVLVLLGSLRQAVAQGNYIWLEGETPTASNIKPAVESTGRAELVSDGRWLHLAIDPAEAKEEVPEEGVLLAYNFATAKATQYEIWNRIGYEASRTEFDWRLDGGDWTTVAPNVPVLDLTELSVWTDIGWLKLGERQLEAGPHKLEIRLPRLQNEKGEYLNIQYASDALLFYPGAFHPNGKFKPGENYRDDSDDRAARNVFTLPAPATPGARAAVKLGGLWEVARHDDNAPGEVAAPMQDFPAEPHWKAITVPGDKNVLRPDLIFAHRLWYRTHIDVPASEIGRSFFISFPFNNLNTTVYLNGLYCGFNKNPFSGFSIDVTKGVKAGANELCVGIKDAYYGFSADPARPAKLRAMFHFPLDWQGKGFLDFDYPEWNAFQSGILNTPEFIAAGSVYAADVFVKPSVASKSLAAELTLQNSGTAPSKGELSWQALNVTTGAVEKTFASQPFDLTAGGQTVLDLSAAWSDPKLWWPDAPHEYDLRTIVSVHGNVVDMRDTRFGFREWRRDGVNLTLNGVIWRLWAEVGVQGENRDSWLANYNRNNMRTLRWSTSGQAAHDAHFWYGLEVPDALDYFDRNGVVVRRNTSPLDGEMIGYQFTESDTIKKAAQGGSDLKLDLMRNWRDLCVAQVRAERNHPSVAIWSIENEFAYVNLINLLGNSPRMDEYEHEITKTSDAVMQADPTRSVMIDGGGALKDNSLPIHGNHYVYSGDPAAYPELAYEANVTGGGRDRWTWDMKRPRFLGEDYFATGINPADYAWIGGEAAFEGKAAARGAIDAVDNMLQQGYRWGGYYAGWHFWLGSDTASNHYTYNAPRAVLVRQYNWTFGSGQRVTRTFGIFNDTQYADPLTFTRTLTVAGNAVWTKTTVHTVAPGTSLKWDELIPMPTVARRTAGRFTLRLAAGQRKLFDDVKEVSILPSPGLPVIGISGVTVSITPDPQLAVYDPRGSALAFLRRIHLPCWPMADLSTIPPGAHIVLVGSGALSPAKGTSSRLAAIAASGVRVIVLDQTNPLKFQALPADIESTDTSGQFAFGEDLNHPVLRGLQQQDFVEWEPGKPIFYNAYLKPTRGARSLVQAGQRLGNSVVVEVPVGGSVMLLSQFALGDNLAVNPVAGQILLNLIAYAATYKLEVRPVAAVIDDDSPLAAALRASGLQYRSMADPIAAITAPDIKLVIVSATPENLAALADEPAKTNAFTKRGGYIVFCGLTPKGLDAYNKIVGFNHMIRPMRRERVALALPRNPLAAGLGQGDVVMLSGERINSWTADEYVTSDMFSYIVDYDEVAPFGTFKNGFYYNMVNGMTNADSWKYIVNVPKTENDYELTLPVPQTITEFTWVPNLNYNLTTRAGLRFDGKDTMLFPIAPNAEPKTFAVDPPRTGTIIDILNAQFTDLPDKNGLIGVDNIYLKARRPSSFYESVKPILNIGGLMQYPRGDGGFMLCNLLFKNNETVPINTIKKRTILTAILRNLDAPFSGASVIAGANLNYQPIDISKQANQYRNERGWFGDPNFTFAALPTGRQTFAGVPYDIYDFPTSPVPTAIMLGGSGIPNDPDVNAVRGISVHRKADALFFLQTARIDRRRDARELRDKAKLEMARYVVTYADGQEVNVPIYAEIDVDDFKQKQPASLPGAQLAWTRPYPNTGFSAVAYEQQWNNPRPEAEIAAIDLEYGADRRGVPALLAITAASAR